MDTFQGIWQIRQQTVNALLSANQSEKGEYNPKKMAKDTSQNFTKKMQMANKYITNSMFNLTALFVLFPVFLALLPTCSLCD